MRMFIRTCFIVGILVLTRIQPAAQESGVSPIIARDTTFTSRRLP